MQHDPEFEKDDPEEMSSIPEQAHGVNNKWQRLVNVMQGNRRWHAHITALRYAKNGMPKNLDGPAQGFGRWQWREITSSWWTR